MMHEHEQYGKIIMIMCLWQVNLFLQQAIDDVVQETTIARDVLTDPIDAAVKRQKQQEGTLTCEICGTVNIKTKKYVHCEQIAVSCMMYIVTDNSAGIYILVYITSTY